MGQERTFLAVTASRIVNNTMSSSLHAQPPSLQVQVLRFHVVCDSSGLLRNTSSSVSVVVNFLCRGPTCRGGGPNETIVNSTEQFQFNCVTVIVGGVSVEGEILGGREAFAFERGRFLGSFRRVEPVASFSTAREDRCGLCVDPAVDIGRAADNETHCMGKLI